MARQIVQKKPTRGRDEARRKSQHLAARRGCGNWGWGGNPDPFSWNPKKPQQQEGVPLIHLPFRRTKEGSVTSPTLGFKNIVRTPTSPPPAAVFLGEWAHPDPNQPPPSLSRSGGPDPRLRAVLPRAPRWVAGLVPLPRRRLHSDQAAQPPRFRFGCCALCVFCC